MYSVYMHKNKINNKIYIGITSREPEIRWNKGNGYWNNKHFYNSIQKYGWDDGFEHIVIKDGLSQEDAEQMEISLISYYDSTNPEKGYNINLGGHHNGQHSDSTRQKISRIQYKEVYQYDRYSGEFLNRFESTIEAERVLGIPNPDISAVCLKKVKTTHNYIFRYSQDGYVFGEPLPKEEVEYSNKNDCFVKVAQYSLEGELLAVYNSIVEAAKSVGLKGGSGITSCCNGKAKTSCGYIWRYWDEENGEKYIAPLDNDNYGMAKPVIQYSMSGLYIQEYSSISEASRLLDICGANIGKCCALEYYHAGHYFWRYKKDVLDENGNVMSYIAPLLKNKDVKKVQQFDLNNNLIAEFDSVELAAQSVGAKVSQIKDCCRGKAKTSHGYIWRYKNA